MNGGGVSAIQSPSFCWPNPVTTSQRISQNAQDAFQPLQNLPVEIPSADAFALAPQAPGSFSQTLQCPCVCLQATVRHFTLASDVPAPDHKIAEQLTFRSFSDRIICRPTSPGLGFDHAFEVPAFDLFLHFLRTFAEDLFSLDFG